MVRFAGHYEINLQQARQPVESHLYPAQMLLMAYWKQNQANLNQNHFKAFVIWPLPIFLLLLFHYSLNKPSG
jgi:hypothetical protein